MQAPWTQFSLPVQRPRLDASLSRPHTVHASSGNYDTEQGFEEDQTPRGSVVPGLGVLPEAGDRRLSRDDTAASVSELLSHSGPANIGKHELSSHMLNSWPEDAAFASSSTQQAPRRSAFRFPSNFPPSSAENSEKTASLGRKFSQTYKNRMVDFKENVSRFRRSSTPQSINSDAARFVPSSVAPTSPSKRNGKPYEGDRPVKRSQFLKTERKDTPAPPAPAFAGQSRPASRNAPPSFVQGGERARKAAAAFNAPPNFLADPMLVDCDREDLNARRARLGSLSSAADSGADLSTYCSSNGSIGRDSDGDVEMRIASPPPIVDPLRCLPPEVSLQIFEYLDAQDLLQAELVCSSWRFVASKTCVWRNAFMRRYERQVYTDPPSVQVGGTGCGRPNRPEQPWKRMYKARLELEANWKKGPTDAGKAVYLSGHTDSVYCLQFDEEKIITGSRDRTIRVWDINNFTCQRVIGGPNVRPTIGPKILRTVDYPDFHLATASVNGTAYGDAIYQVPSQWHDASILCLQYDEKILVTGSSDSDLLVWDIKTYEPIQRLKKHTGGVLDVALDAKHIVSCSKDSRIIVWDRETYEPKGELSGHRGPVNAVQLRGKYLVSASGDGIARLWDLEKLQLVKEFSAKERGLAAVEFSEDMKYVLAGGNDTITYKFETETGKEVKQFVGHSQLVRSLWLDSQNNRVVSGSYDLDLRVYDFTTGEEIWRAEEWTTSWMLAAKSDYRRIVATSQDGRLLIIDFGLQKCRTPDDGQPIPDVELLRGTDNSNAIVWTDPWKRAREQDRERDLKARQAMFESLHRGGVSPTSS